jgi:peptidyl-prolyl cis-trans isomerase D
MLQAINDKLKRTRWLGIVLLGLLGLVFALWGAYGVVNLSFSGTDYGLKVNDERISTETLNRAWQQRQAQFQQSLNGAEMTDAQKSMLQQQLIDEYVRQSLLRQRAQQSGFRATDEQVKQAVTSEPAFQLDGKYDARVARNMLAQVGMTEDSYLAERREALQIGQLSEAIELSDFLTPAELDRIYALENEQRELRYALLNPDHFLAAVKIDDARIKAWYDSHPKDYMSPESVRLQYAELSLDSIASQLTVTPEELHAYYDKNQARYGEIEKRHAHHILIALPAGADAAADAAALAKAQDIVAQLKAGPDFAELSKKYSADPGSATLPHSPMRCSACSPGRSVTRSRRSTAITSSGWTRSGRRTCAVSTRHARRSSRNTAATRPARSSATARSSCSRSSKAAPAAISTRSRASSACRMER